MQELLAEKKDPPAENHPMENPPIENPPEKRKEESPNKLFFSHTFLKYYFL